MDLVAAIALAEDLCQGFLPILSCQTYLLLGSRGCLGVCPKHGLMEGRGLVWACLVERGHHGFLRNALSVRYIGREINLSILTRWCSLLHEILGLCKGLRVCVDRSHFLFASLLLIQTCNISKCAALASTMRGLPSMVHLRWEHIWWPFLFYRLTGPCYPLKRVIDTRPATQIRIFWGGIVRELWLRWSLFEDWWDLEACREVSVLLNTRRLSGCLPWRGPVLHTLISDDVIVELGNEWVMVYQRLILLSHQGLSLSISLGNKISAGTTSGGNWSVLI